MLQPSPISHFSHTTKTCCCWTLHVFSISFETNISWLRLDHRRNLCSKQPPLFTTAISRPHTSRQHVRTTIPSSQRPTNNGYRRRSSDRLACSRCRNAQLPPSPPTEEPRPTTRTQLGLLARQAGSITRPSNERQQQQRSRRFIRRQTRSPSKCRRRPQILERLQQLRHQPAPPPRQRAPLPQRRETSMGRPSKLSWRGVDVSGPQNAGSGVLAGRVYDGDWRAVAECCGERADDF